MGNGTISGVLQHANIPRWRQLCREDHGRRRLAALLNYRFFDLDDEIERFYETPIERLQNRYPTLHQFRTAAARALKRVLARADSHDCVIALPPSGLMGGYWKIVKTTQAPMIVLLSDTPENILRRITFYDIDSRPVARTLTDREKGFYLRRIRDDIAYFRRSFQRAHITVDIAGCGAGEACRTVQDALTRQSRTAVDGLSVFPAL